MFRHHSIFFTAFTLLLTHSAAAQLVTEEPFPKLPFSQHSEKIIPGNGSTFFVVGSTTSQRAVFEDTYGITIPYYFKRAASQNYPIVTIPDTNHFYQRQFDWLSETIKSDFAVDGANTPYIVWSKFTQYWQDYSPFFTYRWKFSTRLASEVGGKFVIARQYESAINPSIAIPKGIHGVRVVYEEVFPLDTVKLRGPDSVRFQFTKYTSTIYYEVPFTPTMPPITRTKVGKGFFPQIKVGYDNQVHVLWFAAESSNATTFRLLYRKANSFSSFDSTKELISIPIYNFVFFQQEHPFQWSADSAGSIHFVLNQKFVLHYNKNTGIQIDSFPRGYIWDTDVRFMPNGEVRVVWREDWGPHTIAHQYYSTSANVQLFSKIKNLGDILNIERTSQILDTTGNQHLFKYILSSASMRKNFTTEKDTTIVLYKGYSTISEPYVDRNNKVWVIGKRDSTPVFLNFSLNDAGKNNFTFPLHVGNEWYYEQYTEPPDKNWPTHHIVKAVRDTTMPNKKSYTELSSKDYWGKRFWRKEGFKIFQFSQRDSSEFIRFDFSKAVKETIATVVVENQPRSIILENINSRLVIGRTLLNFRFMGDIVNDYYGRSGVDVSDSIGITHFGLMGPEVFLIGAKINGKQYGTILGIENEKKNFPISFSLSQNYPNPFNPTTIINYQLTINSFTTLKIFDVIGREVATLVNEVQEAGSYEVKFDASKVASGISSKGGYASGVYFYALKSGEFRAIKKMSVVK